MKKIAMLMLTLATIVMAQVNLSGDITSNTTWTAGTEYILTGQTFVKSGVTLTIEPGVIVKANSDDGNGLAPALVVERGGKIMAEGTADMPITFTANVSDDQLPQRGLWGGLILLGNAPTNKGESFVEGLEGVPYGGNDPMDNSGVLKYVRVWYGGAVIGQDNEINGITFAGVGAGTTVEHCEVAWNLDDGFEFFGGTVNIKYLSALFCGDDAFDSDEGYQGKGQFLFAMLGQDICGRGFEMDNNGSSMDIQPRSMPMFSNVTLIGPGGGTPANDGSDAMIRLREGTGGVFRNMLVTHGNGIGVRVSDQATLDLAAAGDSLTFSSSSIVFGNTEGQFHTDLGGAWTARDVDPQYRSITDRESGTGLVDPRPTAGSPALSGADDLAGDDFYSNVAYVGAFGDYLWLDKWSYLETEGRLPGDVGVSINNNEIADGFRLLSNYPNPFNPVTNLRYDLPNAAEVMIQVYNLNGQLAAQLDLGLNEAGYHEISFNPNSFRMASGLYVYRISAGNYTASSKMLYLK